MVLASRFSAQCLCSGPELWAAVTLWKLTLLLDPHLGKQTAEVAPPGSGWNSQGRNESQSQPGWALWAASGRADLGRDHHPVSCTV